LPLIDLFSLEFIIFRHIRFAAISSSSTLIYAMRFDFIFAPLFSSPLICFMMIISLC